MIILIDRFIVIWNPDKKLFSDMEKEIVELTDEYKIKLKKLQEDYSIILDF